MLCLGKVCEIDRKSVECDEEAGDWVIVLKFDDDDT
jgi:hypothetical protein